MQRKILFAAALLSCLVAEAAPSGADAGKALFGTNCAACHTVDASMTSREGPGLYGVMGRKIGAVSGFKYTEALAKAAAAGKVWTREELDLFLIDPDAAMPGTLMPVSVEDPEERAQLLDYLQTLTGKQTAAVKTAEPAARKP